MATQRVNKLRFLILLLAVLFSGVGLNAQGWRFLGGLGASGQVNDDGNYTTGVHQFQDGSYGGISNNSNYFADYGFAWVEQHNAIQNHGSNSAFFGEGNNYNHYSRGSLVLSNDGLLVLEEKIPFNGGDRNLFLSLYQPVEVALPQPHKEMQFLWHKPLYTQDFHSAFAHSLIQAPDGNVMILAGVQQLPANSNQNVLLVKAGTDGTPLWSKIYDTPDHDYGVQITAASDGGYYILKTLRPESDTFRTEAHLMKVDAAGTQQWEVNLSGAGNDQALDMAATQDGGLAITGVNKASGWDAFLLKTDASGNILWRRDYLMPNRGVEGRRVVEDQNGDLVVAANQIDSITLKRDIYLMKSDASGLPLWERNIGLKTFQDIAYDLMNTTDGGYLVGGSANPSDWPLAMMVKTDVNGIIKPGRITGNVVHDLDLDCLNSAGDTPLKDWVVEAKLDDINIYFGTTDSTGNYTIACDTGDYVVRLIPPVSYWNSCVAPTTIHVGYQDTVQIDFPVQNVIDCPYLTISHGVTPIRPCSTTVFIVHYCNTGPVTAEDAYFTFELDPLFTFVGADTPPSEQNGNLFTFQLNDLESGECGDFHITATVNCAAELGQVACTNAHIYPDSLCTPPDEAWSGAQIRVENSCDGDSVRFKLINQSEQAMPGPLQYIIIEDAVLLMDNYFQLGPHEERNIALPANGSTYHLIAEQEPFAPGNSLPLAAVEACGGSPANPGSTGYFNQYPQNDGDPFVSENCPIVLNSFDPNDKQAVPTGFGPEHYIYPNTDLEYTIRFQNTGNDTAFRVVLLDTISRYLDPASIEVGASSHPVQFSLEGNRLLRFTFLPILLPDSTTNPEASQGFVTFRIRQNPDNPINTVIENKADIYFDFNVPVRTNTVFHTIHESPFEVVTSTSIAHENTLEIAAYPNPFSDQLRIKLDGAVIPNATFHLYHSTGQLVRTLDLNNNEALLQREGLDAGFYFFTVQAGAKMLGTGKVVVK
ncbi:MAG TPA: T9SS type A sorting domain-containing protein [Saprospiraceae bacterium]|nr:T9SS type A sorting domain-containing protein [Saprospiraceae bacterium]HPI07640.1 T9SS type A sorting domain-containing protein [Saprospiraceae bacterium]